MIYSLTPNPALDISGTVDEIVPDEKNYVYDERASPGGNGINAARMITTLNAPVIASGFLGGGNGQELARLLKEEGVRHSFIPIQGNTRMGITVNLRKTHHQTRLSFQGPKILRSERQSFFQFISKIKSPSILVLGGSLPPGFSTHDVRKALQIAAKRKIPCVVDIPGKLLREVVSHTQISFIKPNLVEFQDLVGANVTSIKAVREASKKLSEKIPLICVSSVEGGALFITHNGTWHGRGPKVKAKSSVGAGDSMVGGMTAQLWKKGLVTKHGLNLTQAASDDLEDIFRWGLACAIATITSPGTVLGKRSQIQTYYPKIQIQKIS